MGSRAGKERHGADSSPARVNAPEAAPLRVAMLGEFPRRPARMPGGVEAVIKNLAQALAHSGGAEMHVVSAARGVRRRVSAHFSGVQLHHVPEQRRLGNLTRGALTRRRLLAELDRLRPDIVHAHGTGPYALAALASPFPCVLTVHGILWKEAQLHSGPLARVRERVITRMERAVLQRAEHIFVIADYVRREIAPYTSARLYPVTNPVDARLFECEGAEKEGTILTVAALRRRKGLTFLLEAFARVRARFPQARLRLIGKSVEPDYAEKLQQAAERLGVRASVTFLGHVSDDDLRRELGACSICALASLEESSPVSIAEAMALSKPVVATRVGGVPDLVEEEVSGLLVPPGDPVPLAEALERLIADEHLRRRMGEAGRRRAERDFHPNAAARRALEVYREILAQR